MCIIHLKIKKTNLDSEVDDYLNANFGQTLALLQFWSKTGRFPTLQKLARIIFAIQVSSAASERVYSTAGGTISQNRTLLAIDTAIQLVKINKSF